MLRQVGQIKFTTYITLGNSLNLYEYQFSLLWCVVFKTQWTIVLSETVKKSCIVSHSQAQTQFPHLILLSIPNLIQLHWVTHGDNEAWRKTVSLKRPDLKNQDPIFLF